MKKKINIALIGCGSWGKNIARNLNQIGTLACIYDTDRNLSKKLSQDFRLKNYEIDDIFKNEEIQALVVASEAKTHKDIAKEALLNNKDVLIEKPFCLSLSDATTLSKLAIKKKRVLMVGHLLNYHNAFIKMKDLVKKGKIGETKNIRAHRLALGAIRSHESVVYDLAVHDVSMVLAIMQELPVEINAHSIHHNSNIGPDAISIKLSFKTGATAIINCDWMCPYKEHKFSIIGTKGALVFDDIQDWSKKLYYNPSNINLDNSVNMLPIEKIIVEENEPLRNELEEFIRCIQSRKKPLTDHQEAVNVQYVLQIIEEKLQRN
ncbi:Gfo/Idh/MocA family oxidoreductase [Alphaproteobacteria bacterium]|nr:Gfo/Idh/MocA family oxidoreductase [Alphaproteobacteria bacterium]